VTLSDPNGPQTTFKAPDVETTGDTLTFELSVVDHGGLENTDSCVVNVIWLNAPPTAHAGPDQTIDEGRTVTLNGSNSTDPDDGIASYAWVQTSGPQVTLSDPNGQQSTFTAPDVGSGGDSLTFELTVSDHNGLQSTDSCVVNVTYLNEPPQANAGPDQTADGGSVVTLDGSDSLDIDDGIVSYSWKQMSGPAVTLSDAASDQPTFAAPNVEPDGVSLIFDLTVTDAGSLSDTDSCVVNITWQNQPPTAVVTPDYTETTEGALVTMDGSGSTDPDDGIVSYLWSQEEGEPVSLSDPTSAVTTFTAPKSESFGKDIKLKLTVKDHGGLQDTADTFVYVMGHEVPNAPPNANFSYNDKKKLIMFIDGSTDSDGTIVSWFWDFGDGRTSTEQYPNNRYVKTGNYMVTLTVTDDRGDSDSNTKKIAVTK
jgi:hypothetical protein